MTHPPLSESNIDPPLLPPTLLLLLPPPDEADDDDDLLLESPPPPDLGREGEEREGDFDDLDEPLLGDELLDLPSSILPCFFES